MKKTRICVELNAYAVVDRYGSVQKVQEHPFKDDAAECLYWDRDSGWEKYGPHRIVKLSGAVIADEYKPRKKVAA